MRGERVFDGTVAGLDALRAWAGDRFPAFDRTPDGSGIARVAVANPGSPMLQWANAGDTIERDHDGTLIVMPVGFAERTVHAKMVT